MEHTGVRAGEGVGVTGAGGVVVSEVITGVEATSPKMDDRLAPMVFSGEGVGT